MNMSVRRLAVQYFLFAILTVFTFKSGVVQSGVPLADSPDGVTCHYYATGFRLAWQKKGGDWLDAQGRAYGNEPFGMERLTVQRGRQRILMDVSSLVRSWSEGVQPIGGIFLGAIAGTKSGLVNFASRENPDSTAYPALVIKWSDGTSTYEQPVADTELQCSTVRSVGSKPIFQVGEGVSAIVVFPFKARPNAKVTEATLILTTDKQYGSAATIGAFRPMLPWTQAPQRVTGLAEAYKGDRGIETDPEVIFVERFESDTWLSGWSSFDKNSYAEPVSKNSVERFEPIDGKALLVTVKKGKTQGLNMHYRFANLGTEPEEIFFRYYLRLGDSWDPTLEGGKMPGLSGTYGQAGWGGRKSDGRNGWSARGSFFRISDKDSPLSHLRGVGTYLYHAGMRDFYGEGLGWDLGSGGVLEKNRWYSVEQQVRMNTPGQHNGILRAWIDGQLVFEKTDIRFRDIPDLRIESVWMNVYHGGTKPAHKDLSLFIDNVVVARKYIGPASTLP